MIEYKILGDDAYGNLGVEIEEHLNNGWKLAGDLKVVVVDGNSEFYQALTKGNPNA